MRRHFERYCDFYGEAHGARLFRKVAPWYAKRFGPAKAFKQRVHSIGSKADFEGALNEYLEWRSRFCDSTGELLPEYRMKPMVASFMEEGVEIGGIPVPRGPIEWW
jgi:hypothetical protein